MVSKVKKILTHNGTLLNGKNKKYIYYLNERERERLSGKRKYIYIYICILKGFLYKTGENS